ncbi:hypothetical protein [Flavobacterium sp. XGLA_31]|uniref:hypothetical protein n=1 Tax=Flavobacterium sp. XGLA_31 TaxID=3447666 RepID=UPI003F3D7E43
MAKQAGIIHFRGTLDGITYYTLNGVPVARRVSGFTKESNRHSPKMERARENSSEFGQASRVKKVFQDSLRPFFGNQKDGALHARMMSLFMQLKDCDPVSVRGQRRVGMGLQTPEGKQLLTSFGFTNQLLVLPEAVYDEATYTYSVDGLPVAALDYRNGATHLEVRLGIVLLDFETPGATLFASTPVYVAKEAPVAALSLTPTVVPTGAGMPIAVLWHRYGQEVNGTFYPLKDKAVYGLQVLAC